MYADDDVDETFAEMIETEILREQHGFALGDEDEEDDGPSLPAIAGLTLVSLGLWGLLIIGAIQVIKWIIP